jgi:hypothetical protein
MNPQIANRNLIGYLWHASFFSMTYAFTDYNSVLPSLILKAGGRFFHIGLMTFISIGFPLFFQILFTSFISRARFKKKFLLLGIHLRIFALAGIGFSIYNFIRGNAEGFLIQIYIWLLLFSMSGALANLPYNHLAGMSFKNHFRKVYLFRKQILTAIGMGLSAVLVGIYLKSFDYPRNYMILFFSASGMLLIASFGFWILKEPDSESSPLTFSFSDLFRQIPSYLREYPNLFYLIIIANILGIFLGFIPFLMGIVKNQMGITAGLVANVVLFQYGSMILSSFLWKNVMHSTGFKGLLKMTVFLAFLMPLVSLGLLSLHWNGGIYLLFFLLGSVISSYRISMEGALLEISTDQNRVLFTGIYGALNILGAIIPLIGGVLLDYVAYPILFLVISFLAIFSFYFLGKLECPVDQQV